MRVFLTGPTGSGKSTLATLLASRAALPIFSLDDIHWVRHPAGDRRRDPAERLVLLDKIVALDAWVIEGVQFKWFGIVMERARCIIVHDLPWWRNAVRILHRFAGRRRSRDPGSRATLQALAKEMRWLADYHGHERRMLFGKIAPWADKLVVVRSRRAERALTDAASAPVWPASCAPRTRRAPIPGVRIGAVPRVDSIRPKER